MADKKITELTALGAAPASGDLIPIVDVSDTTDSPQGTTKKVAYSDFGAGAYAGVASGGVGALDFAQGTKTADEPFIDGSVTWNSAGVTFAALRLSITDTNSQAVSNLINLLVGGSSVFRVQKQGRVYSAGGNGGAPSFSFEGDTDTGMWSGGTDKISFSTGGFERVSFDGVAQFINCDFTNGMRFTQSGAAYRWNSSTRLLAPSNGQLRVEGNSNGQGDRVILGTVDASGAMIKRNGTRLEAKLGGDSAYTQFTCEKLGVNNSAAATSLGSVTKKMEVFDAAGASLGFVPIYDAIT